MRRAQRVSEIALDARRFQMRLRGLSIIEVARRAGLDYHRAYRLLHGYLPGTLAEHERLRRAIEGDGPSA